MSNAQSKIRSGGVLCALASLIMPWSPVHAGRAIEERRAADPQGEVEIVNVAGSVEVAGWDRSEVEVSGTAGSDVERVDVTSAGNRTSIRVVPRSAHNWSLDGEARLIVHVPARSMVTATLVSADFKVEGVAGDLKLQTVSGSLKGEAGGDLRASTVSGEVQLAARAAKNIEVRTISGDVHLTGGGGEVAITTVSGNATLELGEVTRARFKTVSGNVSAALGLAGDGQLEGESVSGDIGMIFASAPAAEFDVQSFSGDIKNCFGPKPAESHYGPGSRLQFTNGDGHGRVRINTKSGDVRLCIKDKAAGKAAAAAMGNARVRVSGVRWTVPYVF